MHTKQLRARRDLILNAFPETLVWEKYHRLFSIKADIFASEEKLSNFEQRLAAHFDLRLADEISLGARPFQIILHTRPAARDPSEHWSFGVKDSNILESFPTLADLGIFHETLLSRFGSTSAGTYLPECFLTEFSRTYEKQYGGPSHEMFNGVLNPHTGQYTAPVFCKTCRVWLVPENNAINHARTDNGKSHHIRASLDPKGRLIYESYFS
ncbi:MAG: hypothetical protein ACYCQJ_05270 [Nitrososphaerales archaeon]